MRLPYTEILNLAVKHQLPVQGKVFIPQAKRVRRLLRILATVCIVAAACSLCLEMTDGHPLQPLAGVIAGAGMLAFSFIFPATVLVTAEAIDMRAWLDKYYAVLAAIGTPPLSYPVSSVQRQQEAALHRLKDLGRKVAEKNVPEGILQEAYESFVAFELVGDDGHEQYIRLT